MIRRNQFEFRPITKEEQPALKQLMDYAFAAENPATEQDAEENPDPLQPQWSLCAFDGEQLAASSGAYPFKIRFNGATMAAAGVTAVAANPGYRRQGLVRELMVRTLHEQHDKGVPAAILWASMGAIYQRFGYGLASTHVNYDIDLRHTQFQHGDSANGYTRILQKEEAMPIITQLYRQYSGKRNLLIHRAPVMWDGMIPAKGKYKPFIAVFYDQQDQPTAYCIYRSKEIENNEAPGPWQQLEMSDFCWLDLNAYRGIWAYLCSHDLVAKLLWRGVPEDDPAPGLLLEPRMLQRQTADGIWMRIIDVESVLSARPYANPGEAVIRVSDDDLCEWNNGCYRIASNGQQVDVERLNADAKADIEMSIHGLASLTSGHSSASWLSRIGRGEILREERLAMIDALFTTTFRPTCPNDF
jgi:predicted acetyltransferase|tara:strand:- start:16608 stop:17849 length:1242 start_codon:yes stop_codon:yes gene_type:complete